MQKLQRLQDCREDKDMTQKEIANLLNTSQKQYSRWETGEYQIPLDKIIHLARIYDVSIDYLCGLTNDRRKFW
jgi:transcriptional regulator with XRE-family HTH domain